MKLGKKGIDLRDIGVGKDLMIYRILKSGVSKIYSIFYFF